MRKLLTADITRVATKIMPWILLAASYVLFVVIILDGIDDSVDLAYFFLDIVQTCDSHFSLIIGFGALMGVYADEFKSMAMIGVIGTGMSRDKFVIGKLLDVAIYTFALQVLTIIFILIVKSIFGVTLDDIQTRFLLCLFISDFIGNIAYVAVAAIFYFLSENAAVGLVAYIAAEVIVPATLSLLDMMPGLAKYRLYSYYLTGMIGSIGSDFIIGDIGGCLSGLFLVISIYIVATTVITILIFRKKELEF